MTLRLGLEFESWGRHSVMPLIGTEPNILKTSDVPTIPTEMPILGQSK